VAESYPQIPGIEIERELGAGAHSVVYLAKHHGELCAVKLPKVKARWTQWIYREAVALARVRHPLLPVVLEVDAIDDLPYLVMELVEGETLGDTLRVQGALDEARSTELAYQLASALAAVHGAGLVHRDVKPRNIIVERHTGSLKLVDFGFATPMERVGAASERAGTAAYAAPEQLEPPGHVDARSDLFAVGRVLFECLSGIGAAQSVNFGGREARARLLDMGVTIDVADIVASLLSADPRDRYPTARALEADLARVRAREHALGPRAYDHQEDNGTRSRAVARRVEHDRLLNVCGDLEKHGHGALVLLRGSRGSGKSFLVESLARELRSRSVTVRVACRQDDPSLSTLQRILEGFCDRLDDTAGGRSITVEDLRFALTNLGPLATLIAGRRLARLDLVPSSRPPPSSPNVVSPAAESLTEGAAEILLRLASRVKGAVIIVDDAQWIDPVSGDALARVAHQLTNTPLSLVLSGRSASFFDQFRDLRPKHTHELDLARLDDSAARMLIADHLGIAASDVDETLATRIFTMSGGTPLGVHEVLGAFLDAGAVRPREHGWLFDGTRTDRAVLPRGVSALFGRRIGELPGSTRRILETAAFVGTSFRADLVSKALKISPEDLSYGLVASRRAGLIEVERESSNAHRFIHDSLRELLTEDVSASERRAIHSSIAEALDAGGGSAQELSFEDLCAMANHYASGETDRDVRRVVEVTRAAGEAALKRFDNDTALRFFRNAREAAERGGISLDAPYFRSVGEASLRLGALDAAVAAFESALRLAQAPTDRAMLYGRLAWVFDSKAEPELAWKALEEAFRAMNRQMPIEDVRSAANTSVRLAKFGLGKLLDRNRDVSEPKPNAEEIDRLCTLHYQNARLGMEYGKPVRVLQSSLESVALASGGAPATRARAEVFHAFVMTAAGMHEAAARSLARAEGIADKHQDLLVTAFCAQMRAMVASWAGDFDEALVLMRNCIDVYGPWYELNEYALITSSAELLNTLRGRPLESWHWMDRTVQRLKRSRLRPASTDFIVQRTRAALAALNRDARNDPWLQKELNATSPEDPGRGYHRLVSWGPRARFYLETNNFVALDVVVQQFEAEGHNPKTVHLGLSEYYATVAHARIHQCLIAPSPVERRQRADALRKAADDVKACGRLPLLKAHALLAYGVLAWVEGNEKKARTLLVESEESAREHDCPWVLYGAARARAHMLRAAGRELAARDQARVAEAIARETGAATRQRWIAEDFGLDDLVTKHLRRLSNVGALVGGAAGAGTSTVQSRSQSHSSSSVTNRQLTALLHVVRAPRRELRTEQQAAAILDELISSLHAERGAIWFRPEPNAAITAVSRHRASEVSVSIHDESPRGSLLRHVQATGQPWPLGAATSDPQVDPPAVLDELDIDRVLAVPLFLYEKPVGALCIERGAADPAFLLDDRSLLEILSHQVPIALEIARLLFEREQLHTSLQQAKKMEAMGQLAGGLAHDFNNMLAAMKVSLNAAQERALEDEELTTELEIIGDAMQRAAQLTGQLLSFSRHQPVPAAIHDVTELVLKLEPMLRRVAGQAVNVVVKTAPNVGAVEVDQSSFDQALVNLLINARDAMPSGGTFTITTRSVTVEGNEAQRLSVLAGDFVAVEVSDTGEGMSAETMTRIFEPFFTTKAAGRGTGLGLATVYAFARNSGGAIDVSSELGKGTEFRVLLRKASRARSSQPVKAVTITGGGESSDRSGPDTILVVDDDDLVRRSIAKILERNGYRVLAASGSTEALDVARQHGSRIALIILDVLMPGLTGPELGRRLYDLNLPAKMLFVSGFSPESIQIEEAQVAAESLLQKPFSQAVLLERVRSLMHS
jgi:eukaryotic-like serine/threonine-protein kinase